MRKFVLGIVFALMPSFAFADGFYVGGLYGSTSIDTGIKPGVGATLDEYDSGYSFFVGNEMSDIFSIEGFYVNFGEASLSGDSGDTFAIGGTTYTFNTTATIASTGSSMGAAGKLNFEMTEDLAGFVKGGMHWWDIEATINAATGSATTTDDGTDLMMRFGAEYGLGEGAALLVGYDSYGLYSDGVSFLNAGLKIKLQ